MNIDLPRDTSVISNKSYDKSSILRLKVIVVTLSFEFILSA